LCLGVAPAGADVTVIGQTRVPGDSTDKSGLTGRYEAGPGESIPADQLGAFGSAIDYTGAGDRYVCVNDRGFGDGTSRSVDRMHEVEIRVDSARRAVEFRLVLTTLLVDEAGRRLVGLSSAFGAAPSDNLRFDPEGLRLGRDGSVYISDEYGPFLARFGRDGKRKALLPAPAKFVVASPAADGDAESAANPTGRATNRGMEGLAITPDGKTLVGAMQSALLQDGGRDGVNARLLALDLADGATREYVYRLESNKTGVSEILAVDATRFLVLERDGKAGVEANVKRLYLVDLADATDVSNIGTTASNGLPSRGLPAGVKAVAKRPFVDFLDQRLGLAGPDFPAKLEGMTFGPDLPDGRRLLIVTSDNDLKRDDPTVVFALAVDPSDLARPSRP
jgi:hypothetical protein